MTTVLAILIGYLLGSIATSIILGKLLAGVDVREHGSGNAGATNTFRVLGAKIAIFVLLLDALKGVAAVLIARALDVSDTVVVLTGIAVICGHNWPLFFKFRGGKGIATTIGVMLSFAPEPALAAGIVALAILFFSRYVSLAALVFTSLMPLSIYLNDMHIAYFWFALVVALLAIWRHRSNIGRLLAGRESKLGSKKRKQHQLQ
ncbi:MAG TPA: glycerol-3-phosphate 1-O-acyltransferase PlsY [Bacilli bacterium]|nr:glycerol-3-phosphate 1-O-acyltransferase PlsY [Bacilli bacterium]